MREERFVINDRSWAIIEPLVPGSVRDRDVTAKNTRLFLEAVLWRVRVGGPWCDLPPGFGEWNSIFRRFRRWALKGVFKPAHHSVSGFAVKKIPGLKAGVPARAVPDKYEAI